MNRCGQKRNGGQKAKNDENVFHGAREIGESGTDTRENVPRLWDAPSDSNVFFLVFKLVDRGAYFVGDVAGFHRNARCK